MKSKVITLIVAMCVSVDLAAIPDQEQPDSLTRELQEIVVTARQPATKLVGSTLVSTITGSNLANLGNALDVLAQLPMIQVTDNAVSVIGKNNIEIYIDGRPMRDGQELQQILSSNIKKVELQMSPGAAYESTTGAVLRIITKRKFVQGLSLSDQFELRRRRKWSVMDNLNLGYRVGDWELFANGTVNHDNSLAGGYTTNTLTYAGRLTEVGSSQHNSYPTTVGVVKAGVNYNRGTMSAGAYYRYNPERGTFVNSGTEWLDSDPVICREINKHIRSHSHLVSAYYENTFADKYMLHFDGDFRQSNGDNSVTTRYPDAHDQDVSSSDTRTSTLWAAKLYLNFPLWQGDVTVGTQDSHTRSTLDYRMLTDRVNVYIPSTLTEANQTSVAMFASWARMFGNFSLSTGLRYEYIDYLMKVNKKRDNELSRRNHLLTPDISLGYTFDDQTQLSLSYKMVTVKPPYSQLTGSLSYVGLHEIEGGNPALQDERMHDIQLFGMWNGFMVQADLIRSLNTYAFVKQLYPSDDLRLIMNPINIDVKALSLYLIWNKQIKLWTPNVTCGFYRQWLSIDGTTYNRPICSYYFDNTFSLPRGWMITANISGRSQGDLHTNRLGSTWFTMNASLGKCLLNKSLTIKLSATDIFNTANYDWTMNTYGIFVNKHQSYDQRGVSINVIYSFHPRTSRYKGNVASESELNRL